MFNPIDMLQAQGGAGIQSMAQQFGLSPEQTRRALEALMPVFAIGLQRGPASDPAAFAQMFGSPMLTQAVLQQAAVTSGVGSQVLRQMLPVMAGAVVASLVHMLLNPPPAEPAAQAGPFPFGPAWGEMMKAFLPPEAAAERAKPAPRPAARGGKAAAPDPKARPGTDLLQQMFQTGVEVQEQNVKAMQGLFDAFWAEGSPPRTAAGAPDPRAEGADRGGDGARPKRGPRSEPGAS